MFRSLSFSLCFSLCVCVVLMHFFRFSLLGSEDYTECRAHFTASHIPMSYCCASVKLYSVCDWAEKQTSPAHYV
ncbi:hypothetical protein STEG23_007391 [Scotinomys teguina]